MTNIEDDLDDAEYYRRRKLIDSTFSTIYREFKIGWWENESIMYDATKYLEKAIENIVFGSMVLPSDSEIESTVTQQLKEYLNYE